MSFQQLTVFLILIITSKVSTNSEFFDTDETATIDASSYDQVTDAIDQFNDFTPDGVQEIFQDSNDMMMSIRKPKIDTTTTESPDQVDEFEAEQFENYTSNITKLLECEKLASDAFDDPAVIDELQKILNSIKANPETNWTIKNLVSTNSNETALAMSWSPPTDTSNVRYYIVEWYKQKDLKGACRARNETFDITITSLDSCTNYEVRVSPATEYKLGKQTVSVEATGITVDKNLLNPQIIENSKDWLTISWNMPALDCVTKYIVTYCNSTKCMKVEVNTTNYNATDLNACTKYNFTIAVHGKAGEFGSANVSGKTEFDQPKLPAPAWTVAGKESLEVFWTLPSGYTCVIYYRVTVSYRGEPVATKNVTDTQITFDNLKSCSKYQVDIVPVHEMGESSSEEIHSNETFAPVLQSPNLDGIPSSTNHQVVLNWFFPVNETNNCEDVTINIQCNYTQVLGAGYVTNNGTSSVNITQGSIKNITETIIDTLSPFTRYQCYSVASNSRGNSNQSELVDIQTLEDVPSPPSLTVYNITDKRFTFRWSKPSYLPGNLTSFMITFSWYFRFHQPCWCKTVKYNGDNTTIIDGQTFSLSFDNGTPYSQYKVQIKAMTTAGWGNYSEDELFNTLPGAPGPVSNLSIEIKENPFDKNILDSFLTWGNPCFMHAPKIHYYNITFIGKRSNYPIDFYYDPLFVDDDTCPNDVCRKKMRLKAEYEYKFYVSGKIKDFSGLGEVQDTVVIFPAGIPPEPDSSYIQQISIDPYKSRRTTTSATILLPVFPDTFGVIQWYAIIISKSGYNNGSFSRMNLTAGLWPDTASWLESWRVNFEIPYQATKFCENLNPGFIVDYGKLKAVKFIIGEDETCPELSSKQNGRSYCNGALKPDTWYDVRMRAFTNGGYRDSPIFTIKTDAEFRVAIVIGSIFGILFLGILTTMMLLVRKCSLQVVLRRFLHSDMPGSPVPTPFNRRKFITHCQQLADNPGKLSNEFQLLQTISVDLQMPTNAACLQANRKKNRYTDILPYDFSRVKLEAMDNDPNSDYINASFIKGFSGDEEYIACQGPKEDTTHDFWRMIDQYDVKLIVMLTQLVEKNKEKCHQYYPTIRETFNYENMSIRCTSELDYRTYTQRTLSLQKENEKRTIIHLHFKDWPDHDVPEDFDAMINFCQIMRRHIAANRGLAVIHCSAGIGRTGTLIAIDILLQHIKENRKLDVFGTVYRLRHHRINMVQRESQYAYIYNCIRQVLKNPYFSKSYKPPSVDPITDNNSTSKAKDNSMTNLVSSLETLKKSSLLSSSVDSAEQIYNNSSMSSSRSSSTTSSPKSRNCLLLQNLRYTKSTSAIYSKPHHNQIVRYNTLDFSALDQDIHEKSSSSSVVNTQTSDDNSSSSIYDNLEPLKQLKSSRTINNDDSMLTQKLLDTSV